MPLNPTYSRSFEKSEFVETERMVVAEYWMGGGGGGYREQGTEFIN